jgi:cell wall assembly regulator SMI1
MTPSDANHPGADEQSISELMERLFRWARNSGWGNIVDTFQSGATETELCLVEEELERPLPAEFRTLLSVTKGQTEIAQLFPWSMVPFSDETITGDLAGWDSFLRSECERQEEEFLAEGLTLRDTKWPVAREVQYLFYSPGWIPIGTTMGYTFLIDTVPSRHGVVDQVIWRQHECIFWIAPSLRTHIEQCLHYLEETNPQNEYGDMAVPYPYSEGPYNHHPSIGLGVRLNTWDGDDPT